MTIRLLLEDFRLTTAEILYHMPDHPAVLQTYIWQDYDQPPHYPKVRAFLLFWQTTLVEAPVHSVRIESAGHLMGPALHYANFLIDTPGRSK